MDFYFITRGDKDCVAKFANELSAQRFNWTTKNNKGKTEHLIVAATLQPIQLWNLSFPKENLDLVLNTLEPQEETHGKNVNLPMAMMRKALGAKKIPKCKNKKFKFPIYIKHMQILGIGIREDERNQWGNEYL